METTMRKIILTVLGAALLAASAVNMAAASEHRALNAMRVPSPKIQQFQNANNSAGRAAEPGGYDSAGPGGYNSGR